MIVSIWASCSVMPYSAIMRLRRASGSSGRRAANFALPFLVDDQRQQVGLGKIAVVVRLLFRAHAVGLAFVRVVEASFLRDLAAGFDNADLPLDFILQGLADEAERVDVLYFGLGAKFFLAARAHADVGIAAQRAFFHVAIADAGVEDDFFQARQVFVGFVGRAHIGFADNFNQRHSGAVQIDGGVSRRVGEAFVQAFARVLFEMQAGDADLLVPPPVSISMKPCSASGLSYCEIWYPLGRSG